MVIEPNPWLTIWIDPKNTIQRIIETNPYYRYVFLIIFGGINQALSNCEKLGLGERFEGSQLLLLSLFIGPLAALITIHLTAWILHFFTSRLGSSSPRPAFRIAYAWSWAPAVYLMPLWGIKYILFRDELFKSDKSYLLSQPVLSATHSILQFVDFLVAVWSLVILLMMISHIARLPFIRTLIALALTWLVISLPIVLLMRPFLNI